MGRLRRRHSRRTDTHVTYWDPFPLAQWQRNSSRDSRLVGKPAPPTGALVLHPGAGDGDERRAASMAFVLVAAMVGGAGAFLLLWWLEW